MLASVYSYRVIVKSVSSCCVCGRQVLSNPVTYIFYVYYLLLLSARVNNGVIAISRVHNIMDSWLYGMYNWGEPERTPYLLIGSVYIRASRVHGM